MGMITVSRQSGSRGEQVAAALGMTVVDREIIGEETGLVVANHDLERVFGWRLGVGDR